MGWWEHGEEGHSFVRSSEDDNNLMFWGDQPADIMADAIWQITIAFCRDLGRMPSKKEIIAGIKFTTNVLDRFADEPKDAPELNPAQRRAIDEYGWTATGGDVEMPLPRQHAITQVRDVLKNLYVKNAPTPEPEIVEDGFGGSWVKHGPDCDMQVVRPGKAQCSCESWESWEWRER